MLVLNDPVANKWVGKGDKSKSSRVSSVPVFHNHGIGDFSILLEVAR